jgi:hypothetical protein
MVALQIDQYRINKRLLSLLKYWIPSISSKFTQRPICLPIKASETTPHVSPFPCHYPSPQAPKADNRILKQRQNSFNMDLFTMPLSPQVPDPNQDRFASFDLPLENIDDNSAGLKCELKTYEARYNARGERLALQVNTRRAIEEPKGRDHDSGFLVTRFYDKDKALEGTELEVQSPHAKNALKSVVGKYPGVNFHSKRVVIRDLPKCIFHYRKELEAYKETLNNSDAADHVLFLLEYMYRSLQFQMFDWFNFMESHIMPPGLYFEDLWMAFRPGALLYTRIEGGHRVFQLMYMQRCMCPDPHCLKRKWVLKVQSVTYDGTDFGYVQRDFHIHPYEGYCPLNRLNIFPLQYHFNYISISKALLERGQKFVSLQGIHHRCYNGPADVTPPSTQGPPTSEHPSQSTTVSHKVPKLKKKPCLQSLDQQPYHD